MSDSPPSHSFPSTLVYSVELYVGTCKGLIHRLALSQRWTPFLRTSKGRSCEVIPTLSKTKILGAEIPWPRVYLVLPNPFLCVFYKQSQLIMFYPVMCIILATELHRPDFHFDCSALFMLVYWGSYPVAKVFLVLYYFFSLFFFWPFFFLFSTIKVPSSSLAYFLSVFEHHPVWIWFNLPCRLFMRLFQR